MVSRLVRTTADYVSKRTWHWENADNGVRPASVQWIDFLISRFVSQNDDPQRFPTTDPDCCNHVEPPDKGIGKIADFDSQHILSHLTDLEQVQTQFFQFELRIQ